MSTASSPKPKSPISGSKLMLLSLAIGELFIGLLLGWLTIQAFSDRFSSPEFHGRVMQSPQPIGDFTLTAHDRDLVHLHDFQDKIVLLYFGYTYCPDVCPATMAELSKAFDMLDPNERDQVQMLMVTVDPERDSAEILEQYLGHFDPSFLGLTGSDEEIAAATAPFGIFYQKQEGTIESGYLVDHTASVSVLDKDGYLRLNYPFNTPGADIAADLSQLLEE
jgi:protein SCO1/2